MTDQFLKVNELEYYTLSPLQCQRDQTSCFSGLSLNNHIIIVQFNSNPLLYNNIYPAGYARIPVVGDTSKPALLHTVIPRTFFSFICKKSF